MPVPLKELVPVVTFVSSFASPKDPSSPSAFLWFSGGFARAYSESAGAAWRSPAGLEDFSVRADGFAALLASLASQYEEVSFEVSASRLVVRSGTFRAQLPVWPGDVDVPREWIDRKPPEGGVEVNDAFWSDVARVKAAASPDEVKPGLCGVYWAPDGGLIAADNFQAAVCTSPGRAAPRPALGDPSKPKGVLIPSQVLALLGGNPGFDRAAVDEESVWFYSSSGAGSVYGRLYSVEFPAAQFVEFMKVVREQAAASTKVEAKGIVNSLERLLFFARRQPYMVKAEVGGDSVRLWVSEEEGDGRSAEETVPAKVEGGAAAFSVDGKALREIMRNCSSLCTSGVRPLYFRSDDGRFEHVLSLLSS